MIKVFIDGSAGTTGLQIRERLAARDDVELITLSEESRKNPEARREAIFAADTVFLCLPDAAAVEAAELAEGSGARIIDASCAHRTAAGWDYGFPELSDELRRRLEASARVANPGCHASGFIALVRPLVERGIIDSDAPLCCTSLTGYSGGGKKMIAEYETSSDGLLAAPRQYGLSQSHKHLPEMKAVCRLERAPVFCPIVSNFYSGMEVTVPLHGSQLRAGMTADDIRAAYKELYRGAVVKYTEGTDEAGFLSAAAQTGTDGMEISVYGGGERIILCARYDNLGKGASGAAVQTFNIMHGIEETKSLRL